MLKGTTAEDIQLLQEINKFELEIEGLKKVLADNDQSNIEKILAQKQLSKSLQEC